MIDRDTARHPYERQHDTGRCKLCGQERGARVHTNRLNCPNCKRAGALTEYEARKNYQCASCTRFDES